MFYVQVNTDNHITASESLTRQIEDRLTAGLGRFSTDITSVDVHLGDENGAKGGTDDKRCVLEAHVRGQQPLTITHHADTIEQAVDGGVDRLKRLLANEMGRRKDHR